MTLTFIFHHHWCEVDKYILPDWCVNVKKYQPFLLLLDLSVCLQQLRLNLTKMKFHLLVYLLANNSHRHKTSWTLCNCNSAHTVYKANSFCIFVENETIGERISLPVTANRKSYTSWTLWKMTLTLTLTYDLDIWTCPRFYCNLHN